ncbi:hypothetical protein Gotur_003287 [Gossypium turneri]
MKIDTLVGSLQTFKLNFKESPKDRFKKEKNLALNVASGAYDSIEELAHLAKIETPTTKALYWADTDTEKRKLGERMGLDTPVVLAVNNGY